MNTEMNTQKSVCRELVTKERLYERLYNELRKTELVIIREQARLDTLRETKRNLDEYFDDIGKAESEDKECLN